MWQILWDNQNICMWYTEWRKGRMKASMPTLFRKRCFQVPRGQARLKFLNIKAKFFFLFLLFECQWIIIILASMFAHLMVLSSMSLLKHDELISQQFNSIRYFVYDCWYFLWFGSFRQYDVRSSYWMMNPHPS